MPEKRLRSALNRVLRIMMPRGSFGIKLERLIDKSYYEIGRGFPYRGYEAVKCLLKNYDFSTILDVGCGSGVHSDIFLKAGKKVTAIDRYSPFIETIKAEPNFTGIESDFMTYDFGEQKFDCVWCSHVLEHQLNAQDFLKKLVSLVKITERGGGYWLLQFLRMTLQLSQATLVSGMLVCSSTDLFLLE